MVKTADQLKNIIEDYIKTTGVQYSDSTNLVKPKAPNVQWQFLVGDALHFTKMKTRDDRIKIHFAVSFTEQITKELENKGSQFKSELIMEVNEFLILQNLTYNWILDNNQITGIDIKTYIDVEDLDRPHLFRLWDNVTSSSNHIGKKINLRVNPQNVKASDITDTKDKTMYG